MGSKPKCTLFLFLPQSFKKYVYIFTDIYIIQIVYVFIFTHIYAYPLIILFSPWRFYFYLECCFSFQNCLLFLYHRCARNYTSQLLSSRKYLYFIFVFIGYFYWVKNFSWTILLWSVPLLSIFSVKLILVLV